jgi:hypothetical protein
MMQQKLLSISFFFFIALVGANNIPQVAEVEDLNPLFRGYISVEGKLIRREEKSGILAGESFFQFFGDKELIRKKLFIGSQVCSVEGFLAVFKDNSQRTYAALIPGKKPENEKLHDLPALPSTTQYHILEPSFYSWENSFDELRLYNREFMLKYLLYVRRFNESFFGRFQKWNSKEGMGTGAPYSILNRFARYKAFSENSELFLQWKQANRGFRDFFSRFANENKLDFQNFYIRIVKKDWLLYVLEKETDRILAAFPVAYGANPDKKSKMEEDDWRTPDTPEGFRHYDNTTMHIIRRLGYSVKPGMTVRCMGIQSDREEDFFWAKYGMNIVIHGSPTYASIGTRASHGCVRMFEDDARVLFDLTGKGTPVVIE